MNKSILTGRGGVGRGFGNPSTRSVAARTLPARSASAASTATRTQQLGVALCSALFLGGCAAGIIGAGLIPSGGAISAQLGELFVNSAVSRSYLMSLWSVSRYVLAALLLGLTLPGVALVPLLAGVRGFFLCYSVSAIVRAMGTAGIAPALALFAPTAVITIPCFFAASVWAFDMSHELLLLAAHRSARSARRGFLTMLLFIASALCVAALCETFLMPLLAGRFAAMM
ncbi:MAG: stage II sporulation protein M [Oscillospiraceae bacterium]|jgi:hypothetical protein|nr:stage II sporulation protein M [Oscillospiraceae bacterium]